jgi:hypothetical protein
MDNDGFRPILLKNSMLRWGFSVGVRIGKALSPIAEHVGG